MTYVKKRDIVRIHRGRSILCMHGRGLSICMGIAVDWLTWNCARNVCNAKGGHEKRYISQYERQVDGSLYKWFYTAMSCNEIEELI